MSGIQVKVLSHFKPFPMSTLRNSLGVLVTLVGLVAVLDLPMMLAGVSLYPQQYLGVFWGLVSGLGYLASTGSEKPLRRVVTDGILAFASVGLGIYVAVLYPQIVMTIGLLSLERTVLGIAAVVVVVEGSRRAAGWPLVVVILAFMIYALFGNFAPGPIQTTGMPWQRMINQLFLGTEFLFGAPLRAAVFVVFAFILFGQILFATGGGEFFLNLAQGTMGKYRGGPAKAAVVGSALFGSMSGSAVANVASTGTFTIPMMKRIGYRPEFAGAVEAVASTGGAVMPPVMGAAAFIMTEFLGVSYGSVVLAATVPAVALYAALLLQVDMRAANTGLRGLPRIEIPRLLPLFREGWIFLVPLLVLIVAIFWFNQDVAKAALYACGANLLLAALTPSGRKNLRKLSLTETCRGIAESMIQITTVCAGAGFVVGLVAYTGLGVSLADGLLYLAGNSLLLLSLGVAIASTILGMGMPATACYILVAILMAPALVAAGVEPVLAHLFAFYFGNLSFLTPPVALAAFAAASIAQAPMMSTCFQAMKLAIAGYIIPFMFLFKPGMALVGTWDEILLALADTGAAVWLLSASIEGRCFRRVGTITRITLAVSAFLLFVPGWESRIIGLVLAAPLFLCHLWSTTRYQVTN